MRRYFSFPTILLYHRNKRMSSYFQLSNKELAS